MLNRGVRQLDTTTSQSIRLPVRQYDTQNKKYISKPHDFANRQCQGAPGRDRLFSIVMRQFAAASGRGRSQPNVAFSLPLGSRCLENGCLTATRAVLFEAVASWQLDSRGGNPEAGA